MGDLTEDDVEERLDDELEAFWGQPGEAPLYTKFAPKKELHIKDQLAKEVRDPRACLHASLPLILPSMPPCR